MDVTDIVRLVVELAVALLAVFVIPWLKAKVGNENMAEFLAWVDIAVMAAEQLYNANEGAKKKDYVVRFLADRGITFDLDELDNAIEAAVLKLHNELYGGEVK